MAPSWPRRSMPVGACAICREDCASCWVWSCFTPQGSCPAPVWKGDVRASSAVENWHSVLRPYLAVHRRLSSGMLALLAVWHNHRIAERGLHRGQSPLMRSGMTQASPDWLVALGYPPHGETYSP